MTVIAGRTPLFSRPKKYFPEVCKIRNLKYFILGEELPSIVFGFTVKEAGSRQNQSG